MASSTELLALLPPLQVVESTFTLASAATGSLNGLATSMIEVEVACRRGPAEFHLSGLAEAAVREARIRVQSALRYLDVSLDEYSLTVSLAPAHLRKSGSGFDLPLAMAILGAVGKLPKERLEGLFFIGELGLDGTLRPTLGVLPLVSGAAKAGFTRVVVPWENRFEASEVEGVEVFALSSLPELLKELTDGLSEPCRPRAPSARKERDCSLFHSVIGQEVAKRALIVAAAGGHNLLLVGPPGAGKSLLARSLRDLLPAPSRTEALETTSLYSITGLSPQDGLLWERPFRAPHHTVSDVGLIGGGSNPRPGEVSLAHNGVLFLDELPEFRRSALEALRQPLEDDCVQITRARSKLSFPAAFQLIAAMNPCPCGHYADPTRECRCGFAIRQRYLSKLSGPLLDRLDLHVTVPPSRLFSRTIPGACPASAARKNPAAPLEQVEAARALQYERFQSGEVSCSNNSRLSLSELKRVFPVSGPVREALERAREVHALSARALVRVLRIARTLADLEGEARGTEHHVYAAISYRVLDIWKGQLEK